MVVKREDSVDQLVRLMGNGNAKVITGIRRCGKSFLLDKLLISVSEMSDQTDGCRKFV